MNVPYVMSATKASSKAGLLTSGCDVLRSFLLNLGPQLEGLYFDRSSIFEVSKPVL
jgi:hypothetical protein